MYLIVGLGNPGPKYERNRHNAGFMVVDELASRQNASMREKFKGLYCKVSLGGDDVVLLKPMTYMNVSGESVQAAMRFFKVPLDKVIVVHDELDLPFETLRLKVGGGTAGHNGLKSIVSHGGGNGYTRLRFGIDRPKVGRVESYVLGDFSADNQITLEDVISKAADILEFVVKNDVKQAMARYHQK